MSTFARYFGNRADPRPVTGETYVINELARFRILMGGVSASVCISLFYGFNLYSNHLMVKYKFSSQDITTITTAGGAIGFLTFPGGILLDFAGPMYVNIAAVTLNTLGSLMMGLTFSDNVQGSVAAFATFYSFMNLGATSSDTGSLMAIMTSFPRNKGACVAIMKTFAGIGSGILATLNYTFFLEKYDHYMYFLACMTAVFGLGSIVLIRFAPYQLVWCETKYVPKELQIRRQLTQRAYLTQKPPMMRFYCGYFAIVTLALYMFIQALCVAYIPGVTQDQRVGVAVGIIVLVAMLFLVGAPLPFLGGMDSTYSANLPVLPEAHHDVEKADGLVDLDPVKALPPVESVEARQGSFEAKQLHHDGVALPEHSFLLPLDTDTPAAPQPADTGCAGPGPVAIVAADPGAVNMMLDMDMDPAYQTTFLQSVRGIDLWLCFFNTLATFGTGILISMNSAQIYRALNDGIYDAKSNALYAAIIGIGNAVGRLGLGFFETWLSGRPSESRPVITIVYPISSISMVLGMMFLLVLPLKSKAVILGFFFDALGNGFSWASTAITLRALFAKDIGKHYNSMFFGGLLAIVVLNRVCYGITYDREASHQRDAAIAAGVAPIYPFCAGKKCVSTTFAVLLAINVASVAAAVTVHLRFRRFVLEHRAAHSAQAAPGGTSTGDDQNDPYGEAL